MGNGHYITKKNLFAFRCLIRIKILQLNNVNDVLFKPCVELTNRRPAKVTNLPIRFKYSEFLVNLKVPQNVNAVI